MLVPTSPVPSALTRLPAGTGRDQGPPRRVFLPALVLALIAAPLTALGVLARQPGEQNGFAVVDGVKQTAEVGDVLAFGRLVGKGEEHHCELPDTTYGLSGTSPGEAIMALEVTGDCQLEVSSINSSKASSSRTERAPSRSATMHDHPDDSPQSASERTFETRGATIDTGADVFQ